MSSQGESGTKNQRVRQVNPLRIRIRKGDLPLARREERESRPAEADSSYEVGELKGVYIISVAARLLAMHPQTLRKYERLGLVTPSRTIGMLRLYSEEDIEKLRLIRHLESNLGLNLAGVEFTLNLVNHLFDMRRNLSKAKEAEQFFSVIEQEISRLFQRLNLPLQDQEPVEKNVDGRTE